MTYDEMEEVNTFFELCKTQSVEEAGKVLTMPNERLAEITAWLLSQLREMVKREIFSLSETERSMLLKEMGISEIA